MIFDDKFKSISLLKHPPFNITIELLSFLIKSLND
jgi:hypothetical protein